MKGSKMNEIMMNATQTGAVILGLSFIAIRIVPKEEDAIGMALAFVFLVGLAVFIIGLMGVIWS